MQATATEKECEYVRVSHIPPSASAATYSIEVLKPLARYFKGFTMQTQFHAHPTDPPVFRECDPYRMIVGDHRGRTPPFLFFTYPSRLEQYPEGYLLWNAALANIGPEISSSYESEIAYVPPLPDDPSGEHKNRRVHLTQMPSPRQTVNFAIEANRLGFMRAAFDNTELIYEDVPRGLLDNFTLLRGITTVD